MLTQPFVVTSARCFGTSPSRAHGHSIATNRKGVTAIATRTSWPSGTAVSTTIVLLDAQGRLLWQVHVEAPDDCRVPALAVRSDGVVYVVGPYEPKGTILRATDRLCLSTIDNGRLGETVVLSETIASSPPDLAFTPTGLWVTWADEQALHASHCQFGSFRRLYASRQWAVLGTVERSRVLCHEEEALFWGRFKGALSRHVGARDCDNYYFFSGMTQQAVSHPIGSLLTATINPNKTVEIVQEFYLRRAIEGYVGGLMLRHSGEPLCLVHAGGSLGASLRAVYWGSTLLIGGYFLGELCSHGRILVSEDDRHESLFLLSYRDGSVAWTRLPATDRHDGFTLCPHEAGLVLGYWFRGTVRVGGLTVSAEPGHSGFLVVHLRTGVVS